MLRFFEILINALTQVFTDVIRSARMLRHVVLHVVDYILKDNDLVVVLIQVIVSLHIVFWLKNFIDVAHANLRPQFRNYYIIINF